jgi:2-polyprenyl-3-methyl-5-hydroxy-6-metoxy-1,4-benzoquinol methylase
LFNKGIGYDGYHRQFYSLHDWRSYRDILSLLVKYSEPGPILDLGAGCGFLIEGMMRWGIPCAGLDGSMQAIDIAQARYPEINIRYHVLSEPFPFIDHSFQTAVMNQVIEHLDYEEAVMCLVEIFRVLKPGGMLLVTSPSRFNTRERLADITHLNMYAPSELENLLIKQGYHNIMAFNTPFALLGKSFLGTGIMLALLKLTNWEKFSATANCIAYKPGI